MKKIIFGSLVILMAVCSEASLAERLGKDGFVYMPTWIYEVTVPDVYTNEPTFNSEEFIDLMKRMPGSGKECVILPYDSDTGPVFERTVKCEDGKKVTLTCDGSTDDPSDNEGKVCESGIEGRFKLKLVVRKYLRKKAHEKKQIEYELNHPISY